MIPQWVTVLMSTNVAITIVWLGLMSAMPHADADEQALETENMNANL